MPLVNIGSLTTVSESCNRAACRPHSSTSLLSVSCSLQVTCHGDWRGRGSRPSRLRAAEVIEVDRRAAATVGPMGG